MASEIVRERVLMETEEELPYATTVIVDNFEEGAKLTRIAATIYCEREGQKGILIGKKGAMLKLSLIHIWVVPHWNPWV